MNHLFGPWNATRVRATIAGWWRDLRIAAGFLTCLPVSPPTGGGLFGFAFAPTTGHLAGSTRMFPLVGGAIGFVAALALSVASRLGLPALACAFVGIAATTALSRALHEDGLADFADGLGGGRHREERLRIMRDSRIGTFGTLAIVFSVGLKAATLGGLTPLAAASALVATGALSRAALPAIMRRLEPARPYGLAAEAGKPDRAEEATAVVLAVVIALLVLDLQSSAVAVAAAATAAVGIAVLAQRCLGGHTGDVLGACQQAAEVAALAAVAAAA